MPHTVWEHESMQKYMAPKTLITKQLPTYFHSANGEGQRITPPMEERCVFRVRTRWAGGVQISLACGNGKMIKGMDGGKLERT
jgi:hypothetical protein